MLVLSLPQEALLPRAERPGGQRFGPAGTTHWPSGRRVQREHGLRQQALAAATHHGFGGRAAPHRRPESQTRRGVASAASGLGGGQPDITLAEWQAALVAHGGPAVSLTLIWQVLTANGLRRKKRVSTAERDTERVKALRGAFLEAIQGEDVTRFKFVDEGVANLPSTT